MTSSNKVSGKIINYNSSFLGEIIFDEKRSSSYLFFVVGMLIFALLTKFNVLAGSPLQSSGTI